MIENLIYEAITSDQNTIEKLAKYKDLPAVFYNRIPNDKDVNWDSELLFPRIIYNTRWKNNNEHEISGDLEVNIWCLIENSVSPEEIGQHIIKNLSTLFLTEEANSYCLTWNSTESFDVLTTDEPKVIGVTISFDILGFPIQYKSKSNPVIAINNFIKAKHPEITLIGNDVLEPIWKPIANYSAIYAREIKTKYIKTNYGMSYLQTDIRLHIINQEPSIRQKLLQTIVYDLSLEGEVIMNDTQPFLFINLQFNTSKNSLSSGQMTITGQFGVMDDEPEYEKLNNVSLKSEVKK